MIQYLMIFALMTHIASQGGGGGDGTMEFNQNPCTDKYEVSCYSTVQKRRNLFMADTVGKTTCAYEYNTAFCDKKYVTTHDTRQGQDIISI